MANTARRTDTFNHVTDAAPEYVDVILWHRVVLAVAALALVVAALGYGVFQLSGTPEETTPVTSIALDELTQQEPPAAIPQRSSALTTADEKAEAQADPEPATPAVRNDMAASGAPAETAPAASPHIESAVSEPVAPESATSKPAASESVATESVATESTPVEPAPKAATPDTASTSSAPDTRYKVRTTILVPAVKRAMITESMRGLEPGTPLTDTRSLNGQSHFSLYQYVDIRGQAGETLIYHWKRNGKTVAKVRIPVGSDKWRNHSSKNFNQNLLGDWQVDVTNQHNMLLVRSEFHLGK